MGRIARPIIPMVAILIVVLFIITYFPWLVMVLPQIFMGTG
jgi:TRAP-type C4-dicarboxylate transport system permease large subunit